MKPAPDDYRAILAWFFVMIVVGLTAYALAIWLFWEVVL